MKLLSTNTKLLKDSSYTIYGLSLAPHKYSGRNVCPEAGVCSDICTLWYRGMTVQPQVRNAMKRRTNEFFDNRTNFLDRLHSDLDNLAKKPNPAARLNVASDIPWEKVDKTLFTDHPNIKFYDYTKITSRAIKKARGEMPDNYHIVYSWSERSDKRTVNWLIKNGVNTNIVVNVDYVPGHRIGTLPKQVKIGTKWWPTVDGDKIDVRLPEVDGLHKAILVRAKIKKALLQKYIKSGFIIDKPFRI